MKFQLKSSSSLNIKNLNTDCLVVTTSCLSELNLNKETKDFIDKIIKQEDLLEKYNVNKTILLFNVPGIKASRILLISSGSDNILLSNQFIEMIKNTVNSLVKYNITNAVLCFNKCCVKGLSMHWQIYQAIFNLAEGLYCFDTYKSEDNKKKDHKKSKINNVDLYVDYNIDLNNNKQKTVKIPKNNKILASKSLEQAIAVSASCKLAKDLANTPPNVCNPSFMAKAAINLAKKSNNIKLTILEKKDLEKLRMGAFLAVAQGSLQPPKLICLEYRGNHNLTNLNKKKLTNDKERPIVFIGKGITFDTGGNSLKPSNSMVGMKYDMCGAASVLGLINFAIEMKLNINIVGIIPLAENMPGRHASRPDDVVTTMSGRTVEILNTDAEGRLILCEALTYCKKFNPKFVIDIATLTGACAAALGSHYSGLFSNNQELANDIIAAGTTANDKAWQFPISEEYHKQLSSDIADLANIGGGQAGSITAACFLAKFAEDYKWAHLDIAGTAYYADNKLSKCASGRPIPMLAQYLLNQLN